MNQTEHGDRHRLFITGVWLLLMVVTIVSTWGMTSQSVPAQTAVIATFLIAAFKIRLVILHFMDLRDAPLPFRAYFEALTLVVTAAILAIYLLPILPAAG